jgi:hypothetical protein
MKVQSAQSYGDALSMCLVGYVLAREMVILITTMTVAEEMAAVAATTTTSMSMIQESITLKLWGTIYTTGMYRAMVADKTREKILGPVKSGGRR